MNTGMNTGMNTDRSTDMNTMPSACSACAVPLNQSSIYEAVMVDGYGWFVLCNDCAPEYIGQAPADYARVTPA